MSTISSSTTSTTAYKVTADTTGTLVIQTGATPTTAVTVGTDQNVTMAGYLNSPNTFGFKNRLFNGGMSIDQRGTAASAISLTTSNQYTVDRWAVCLGSAQSGTLYGYQVATSTYPFTKALRLYKFAGTWSGDMIATQVIESINCYDLAGQSVTVSIQARRGSDFAGTFACTVVTGTGTDQGVNGATGGSWTTYASTTPIGSTSLTTSFVTYTGTVSIPAGTNEIAIKIYATHTANSGSSNNWVEITGVQLEKGSTATSFDYRPYGTELVLCQRYYEVSISVTTGSSGANWTSSIPFKATKRTSPTIAVISNINGTLDSVPTVAADYASANHTVSGGTAKTTVSISAEL